LTKSPNKAGRKFRKTATPRSTATIHGRLKRALESLAFPTELRGGWQVDTFPDICRIEAIPQTVFGEVLDTMSRIV
jgi:hypothetical protein